MVISYKLIIRSPAEDTVEKLVNRISKEFCLGMCFPSLHTNLPLENFFTYEIVLGTQRSLDRSFRWG